MIPTTITVRTLWHMVLIGDGKWTTTRRMTAGRPVLVEGARLRAVVAGSKGKVTKDGKKPKGGGDTNSFYKAIKSWVRSQGGRGVHWHGGGGSGEGNEECELGKAACSRKKNKAHSDCARYDSIFKETVDGPSRRRATMTSTKA